MFDVNQTRMLEHLIRNELRKRMKARRVLARKTWQSKAEFEVFIQRVDERLTRLHQLLDTVQELRDTLRSR